ncbi:hypothetical protein ABZX62_20215 [Streptomyces flavidovirens]|uniref:hypothetical protein n=1 Tax=Streptomyces flavidovirens TaxID=67298 RepID=UPI0033B62444
MVSYTEQNDRRHTGRMFTAKVKAVCGSCNNGWMSSLEGDVMPTLLPMVKGEVIQIAPEAQELLATWTLKTALMCQLMQSDAVRNLPTSHYADLFRDRRLSGQMRAFTSYMVPPQYLNGESPVEYRSIPSEVRFTSSDGLQHRLWATVVTLRIGYAVLQLVSVGPEGYDYDLEPAAFAPYTEQIWPVQESICWPPRALGSISDLDQFADPLKETKVII